MSKVEIENKLGVSTLWSQRNLGEAKFERTRKAVETGTMGECFHSCFKFFQTFMSDNLVIQ